MKSKENYRVWMVRAGEGGYLIDDFRDKGVVAIGWNHLTMLPEQLTQEELKALYRSAYPEDSDGRMKQCCGQIWRFAKEFKIGDKIVSYDSTARDYYLGEIISDYYYDTNFEYHHCRKVEWMEAATQRDVLQPDTKNSLGSIATIFELSPETWDELIVKNPAYISEEEEKEMEAALEKSEEWENKKLKEETISRSQELIKDLISSLTWQDTEVLVSGLFKSIGYRVRMTQRGGDLGSDMMASPDELGLEEPRVRIEVKKRSKDKIQAPEIRSFIGGMRDFHKGVFVTTSGFTKEAQYEAERANFAITLVDIDWLVSMLISNYETLEPEIKALVPLKKIYWPV